MPGEALARAYNAVEKRILDGCSEMMRGRDVKVGFSNFFLHKANTFIVCALTGRVWSVSISTEGIRSEVCYRGDESDATRYFFIA